MLPVIRLTRTQSQRKYQKKIQTHAEYSQKMVLESIIKNPKVTTVDLALMANITERTVHRAVEYLKESGLVNLMALIEGPLGGDR